MSKAEQRALVRAALHYLDCTAWRDRPSGDRDDPDGNVLERRAALTSWIARPGQCPDCDQAGPPSRRTQPHMGQCGTCGRHP